MFVLLARFKKKPIWINPGGAANSAPHVVHSSSSTNSPTVRRRVELVNVLGGDGDVLGELDDVHFPVRVVVQHRKEVGGIDVLPVFLRNLLDALRAGIKGTLLNGLHNFVNLQFLVRRRRRRVRGGRRRGRVSARVKGIPGGLQLSIAKFLREGQVVR